MKGYLETRFCEALDAEWPIVIGGNEYSSSDVLKVYAPHDYDALFTEWIELQKTDARQRVKEFLSDNGCLPRFNRLAERVDNNLVLPFVGAGMSKPSGFSLWGTFLEKLSKEDPELVPKVEGLMASGDFEGAAQCVADRFNENVLAEQVENYFGRRIFEVKGPVLLLPELFQQGCATTNFDIVLEKTYHEYGTDFTDDFAGEELKSAPRKAAAGANVLFKIHGHADDANGRVLTKEEYEKAYGNDGALPGLLANLIANRSLLFLGCSLALDRTIQALRKIKAETAVDLPRHYAFLKDPGPEKRAERRAELEQAEIHPIWYPVEDEVTDHDNRIEDLLIALIVGPIDE